MMRVIPEWEGRRMTTEIRSDRILSAIRSLPVFRGISPDDQKRLAALASLREYRRGDFLWHAGDSADHLTVIVRGRVKIVAHGEGGDVILELFGEGEPVGAIAGSRAPSCGSSPSSSSRSRASSRRCAGSASTRASPSCS